MQLQYGGYLFPQNAVAVTVRRENLNDAAGLPYEQKVCIDCEGWLYGDTQASLVNQCGLMEAALRVPFRDLLFKTDGGGVALGLTNANSVSGVRIIGPNYPIGKNNEFANMRTFTFTAEATYMIRAGAFLLHFVESISMNGGVPRIIWIPLPEGPPQKQIVCQQTTFKATQQGEAVGNDRYPPIPSPIWPAALTDQQFGRVSPARHGISLRGYRVSWAYQFESDTPFTGLPHIWR